MSEMGGLVGMALPRASQVTPHLTRPIRGGRMILQLREKQDLLDKLPLMGDPDASPINLMLAECKSSSDQKGSQILTCAALMLWFRAEKLVSSGIFFQ